MPARKGNEQLVRTPLARIREPFNNMLLAQSASLDAAMSEGLGIIARFLFIVAVIVIAHGGWQS
jgi:hypothetical protein